MKNLKKIYFLSTLIFAVTMFIPSKYESLSLFTEGVSAEKEYKVIHESTDGYLIQPDTDWGVYKEKVQVKGIYVSAHTLNYNKGFNKLIDLLNYTELNAMVIDVKNDLGKLTYTSNIDIAEDIGANKKVLVKNFDEKMDVLRENNVYPIARIVTFKDRVAGTKRPDLAIKSKNGNVWRDNKGNTWLNPYNKEAWEYPIKLAEEAALKGFKEIQFDYVRFPTDGNRAMINYGQAGEEMTRSEAIAAFLDYARERLEAKGAYVSADVFGHIINVDGDAGIGQNVEKLVTSVDILCPMVYPSHYNMGSYGVKYPDSNPYKIVYEAMSRGQTRIDKFETEERKAIQRPWLQDFSATWLREAYGENYISYGPEQIRAQIQAAYDAGLDEWLFWNASNIYTEKGYEREE